LYTYNEKRCRHNYPAKTLRLFVINASEGRIQSHVLPGFNIASE